MLETASASFENENTWNRMNGAGNAEDFHAKYEEALRKVKTELGQHHPMYIDGEESTSADGEFADRNAIDSRIVLGYFQMGSRKDVVYAIGAAKRAFENWSRNPWKERVALFRRAADIMSERKFELATLQSMENGKNRYEAVADVDEAIDMIRFYAAQLAINEGFTRPMGHIFPGENTRSVMKPYGVWGVIPPFNFPLAIAVGMSTGVMITGNTIILKPASDTPYMSLKFFEVMRDAGLPKGVMNFVTGPGSTTGAELVENPEVSGIAFTGSRSVGEASFKKFNENGLRPFIAEMGGKNAAIVTAKADLEKAAEGVMRGAFGFGGQKCSATSRVYVEESVKDEFLARLVEKTKALKIGDPTKREIFLGPIINESALRNYQNAVELAKKDGKILSGGKTLREGDYQYGFFVEPTIVDGLPHDHKLFFEELFVPILCVASFTSVKEAIDEANKVEYGLTAGIFSNDQKEVEKFFETIEAGVVYANRTFGATTGAFVGVQPFVGWKHSGSTGKGAGGVYYLQQFLREESQTTYA